MNIIIPATGIGKRFKEAGYKELKPFIKVMKDKVILDYVIECFDTQKDVFYFIIQECEKNKFEDFILSRKINAKIIVYKGQKLGPAGSLYGVVSQLQDILNEEVIISYCDFGQEWNYRDFIQFTQENLDVQAIIPCYTGYHPHLLPLENVYAVCKVYDNTYKVYEVIEKYNSKNKFEEYYSSGIYYFRTLKLAIEAIKKQIEAKDKVFGEYYISMTNNYLENVLCYPFIEKFYQFGTPKDFEYAKKKLNSQDVNNEKIKIQNTIILSAGRGERFLNLNFNQPKPFLPLGKTSIIENIIDTLKDVETKIICVGAQDHKKYWESIKQEVRFVKPNKIGAAYSYKESCGNLSGDVLILPCDLIAKHITKEFIRLQKEYEVIVFVTHASKYNVNNSHYFTWVDGENNKIDSIFVKNRSNDANLVMIGSFYFKANSLLLEYINKIFQEDIKTNGEFYIDNVFELLIKTHKVGYVIVSNYFSYGTPDEYMENKYWRM
ncbi:NTP transferase domain-containing protein [Campylobacter jejuni]|uniref:sugar phosphate nucleotidyltransferase n=1 Tax=Campylobacter jejuni TaxID=197 RepID=UPI0013876589|nr:sugar phosphate nucleotidyltransferase [Campylobacter jejuni]MBX0371584.1 NTP transferase domain-containing protein [Campylobacter jejuni]MBX0373684.1 NTP transferase domain-containing protein [Campylobacter jejuni]MBX0435295.1 NTP transferase domain-containing protein [Campylobacter jejuni]MBX0439758.1 NTP transferase domain-containing protein [Campylobacter jejuni]MBX0452951.1 NTP transferase domain-containing protein [Campylobacter jejuni]